MYIHMYIKRGEGKERIWRRKKDTDIHRKRLKRRKSEIQREGEM